MHPTDQKNQLGGPQGDAQLSGLLDNSAELSFQEIDQDIAATAALKAQKPEAYFTATNTDDGAVSFQSLMR